MKKPADPELLREWLMLGHNKELALRTAEWIGCGGKRFSELVGFMVSDDPVLSARAAWVFGICVEAHPRWLAPVLPALLDRIERRVHPAVTRNLFRCLQTAPIPGELEGRVLSAAMAALGGPGPVAEKAFGMTVLKRLAGGNAEMLEEIRLLVREQFHEASPAFRARAKREFGIGKDR